MRLTERFMKKVNIFSPSLSDSGYVGKKVTPSPVGFVYAEVFPDKTTLSDERGGSRENSGAVLVLRRDAGVKCGDLAGVFGDAPDSRVTEVAVYPSHISARTELL